MSYETIRLDEHDGVAVLTLNQPEKRNAMTPDLTREYAAALEEVARRPEWRALVITGAGSAFCAGGDLAMLKRMLGQAADENRREMGAFYRTWLSPLRLDVPVIAAINGHAVGAGAAFTLGCDLRLLTEGARIGFNFLNLGLHPGMGVTHLLPQTVGAAAAADLLLTGRLAGADEALALGLVNEVLSREVLLDRALAIAGEIAAKPPGALRMTRRALVRAKLEGLEAALDYEATAQAHSYGSAEMRLAFEKLRHN